MDSPQNDNLLDKSFISTYKVERDVDKRSNVLGSVVIKSDENKREENKREKLKQEPWYM